MTVAEEHEAAHQAECGKDIGPPGLPDLSAPPEILDPGRPAAVPAAARPGVDEGGA